MKGILKWVEVILWIAAVVQMLMLGYINLTQMQYHMGYDASSYYLKAIEMWKQGTPFITHWVNQTTLYFDSAVPIAALFMNVFHNIFLSYGLANYIVDILIVFILLKILSELKISTMGKAFAVNLAICPYLSLTFNNVNDTAYFSSILTSGCWYGVKLLFSLLFIYAWIVLRKAEKLNTRAIVLSLLTFVTFFISGTSSGYYLAVTILIPAFMVGVILTLYENKMICLLSREMVFTYINIVLILIGKVISTKILLFASKDSTEVWVGMDKFWQNLGSIFIGYTSLLQGMPIYSDVVVMNKEGLMYAFGMGITIITLVAFILFSKIVFKNMKAKSLFMLPVMVMCFNVFMFAILYTTYGSIYFEDRYLIIPYFAVLICVVAWIDSLDATLLKKFGCVALMALVLLQTARSDKKYNDNKIDTNQLQLVEQAVSKTKAPVVYVYGDAYGILQRNIRAYDYKHVYKSLGFDDQGNQRFDHWGDYTYYDQNADWDGEIVLCTDANSFLQLPQNIQMNFKQIATVNELIIYESKENILGAK